MSPEHWVDLKLQFTLELPFMATGHREKSELKYKRVVIKLSGEALRNPESGIPISGKALRRICTELKEVHRLGVDIGLVVGGGNIFRGLSGQERGVDRTTGDYMGMLSTVINGLALMDYLEKIGLQVRLQTAIPMDEVGEPFILRRAVRHMEKGRLVIFVAGTGNPYFSTDTAAALRASEIGADVMLKATDVDGVYNRDPKVDKSARKYHEISFVDVLRRRLKVMDSTAFSLCLDNNMPIHVFNLNKVGNIKRAVLGGSVGTLVH